MVDADGWGALGSTEDVLGFRHSIAAWKPRESPVSNVKLIIIPRGMYARGSRTSHKANSRNPSEAAGTVV